VTHDKANGDQYWDHLLEWFDGRCSPDKAAAIARWVQNDPQVAHRVEIERAHWRALRDAASPLERIDTLTALRALQARRDAIERYGRGRAAAPALAITSSYRHNLRRSDAATRLTRVAAMALVAIGGGIWIAKTMRHNSGVVAVRRAEYASARGQQLRITLPDGSHVVLAPESKLTFAVSSAGRDLSLQGEAFFDVFHDTRHPFVVRTTGATTRDVGTAFTIRAYPREEVSIAVQSGQVVVNASEPRLQASSPVLLSAGLAARVSSDGRIAAVDHADLSGFFSWQNGVLSYDRVPLRTILADLGRVYDLDITVVDPVLAERPLVVSIDGLSPFRALTVVTRVIGARFERHGSSIVVHR
jgi:ferric-dicitrate binding protein FerR (iron transport regulator)